MKRVLARTGEFLRRPQFRRARQVVIAVSGGSVVLVGIAMIVLPGPAVLVIPLGLAILGTEFLWAQRWLHRARALLPRKARAAAGGTGRPGLAPVPGPALGDTARKP
jgi:hypothetical protein